jgi:hypothetical protein
MIICMDINKLKNMYTVCSFKHFYFLILLCTKKLDIWCFSYSIQKKIGAGRQKKHNLKNEEKKVLCFFKRTSNGHFKTSSG